MRTETIAALERKFVEFPRSCASPVPHVEIVKAAEELGIPFPQQYVEFLEKYGGAEVGPYPIFGLRKAPSMGKSFSVIENTKAFQKNLPPGSPKWLIFSEDHAGNSVGLTSEGKVCMWDHDYGEFVELADSFEGYLRKVCLELPD